MYYQKKVKKKTVKIMGQIIINLPESANTSDIQALVSELRKSPFLAKVMEVDFGYIPNKGDFVAFEDNSLEDPFIGIFKDWYCESRDKIKCYAHINNADTIEEEEEYWNADKLFRPATEEEKERLVKALAKKGIRWNTETLEFEECRTYEAIQTYEDAFSKVSEMAANGNELAECLIKDLQFNAPYTPDLLAYIKLRIVVFAINDGWTPKFEKGENRYYPWFYLRTKEEMESMTEEQQASFKADNGRVLGRSHSNANANAGVAYSNTNNASSLSVASSGARLCFFDRARAEYAGRHFMDLYVAMNLCMTLEEEK